MTRIKSLFIACPTFGPVTAPSGPTSDFLVALAIELTKKGIEVHFERQITGPFGVARDLAVHSFLRSNCDALLTIDADTYVRTADVFAMAEGIESGRAEIIGVVAPGRFLDWSRMVQAARTSLSITPREMARAGGRHIVNFPPQETPRGFIVRRRDGSALHFLRVQSAGLSCCILTRHALERVAESSDTYLFGAAIGARQEVRRCFPDCPVAGEFRDGDIQFCDKAAALGFDFYAYADALATHVGTFDYVAESIAERMAKGGVDLAGLDEVTVAAPEAAQ